MNPYQFKLIFYLYISTIFDIAISDAGEPWLITQAVCLDRGACTNRTFHLDDSVWRPVGFNNPGSILINSASNI